LAALTSPAGSLDRFDPGKTRGRFVRVGAPQTAWEIPTVDRRRYLHRRRHASVIITRVADERPDFESLTSKERNISLAIASLVKFSQMLEIEGLIWLIQRYSPV